MIAWVARGCVILTDRSGTVILSREVSWPCGFTGMSCLTPAMRQ